MATYLENRERKEFTGMDLKHGMEVAEALGLRRIDSRNFRGDRGYVGFRRDSIQIQGLDQEAWLLLALATYATRFITDQLVGRGNHTREYLTNLLPIFPN